MTARDDGALCRLARSRRRGRCSSLEMGPVENIKIRINGHSAGVRSSDSQGTSKNNQSSQSMLLDHEDLGNSGQSGRGGEIRTHGYTWRTNTNTTNDLSLRARQDSVQFNFEGRPVANPQPTVAGHWVDHCFSLIPKSGGSVGSFSPQRQYREGTNESASQRSIFCEPASNSPELPVRRHFTIDDQVLSQKMDLDTGLDSSRWPTHGSPHSPRDTQVESHRFLDTDSISGREASGWPPQAQNHIERSVYPSTTRLLFFDAPSFPRVGARETNRVPPPVKIFGQFVRDHDINDK